MTTRLDRDRCEPSLKGTNTIHKQIRPLQGRTFLLIAGRRVSTRRYYICRFQRPFQRFLSKAGENQLKLFEKIIKTFGQTLQTFLKIVKTPAESLQTLTEIFQTLTKSLQALSGSIKDSS